MREVHVRTALDHKFTQHVEIGSLRLLADEPAEHLGEDLGPAPHEWLLAGLGACTSMTLKMYAERKGWPVRSIHVVLDGTLGRQGFDIRRRIEIDGEVDDEQRKRLLEIADKCPVHKTLAGTITIATAELRAPDDTAELRAPDDTSELRAPDDT